LTDDAAKKLAHDRLLGLIFLNNLKDRPKDLMARLQDDFLQGTDSYPKNFQAAFDFVCAYSQTDGAPRRTAGQRSDGQVSLAQGGSGGYGP